MKLGASDSEDSSDEAPVVDSISLTSSGDHGASSKPKKTTGLAGFSPFGADDDSDGSF